MGKIIGVVSFKGGVGKTTSSLNLAAALSKFEKKVLIVEGNFLSPTLNIYLGLLNPEITLKEVLTNNLPPHDAIYEHNSGLHVMPCNYYKDVNFERFKDKILSLKQSYDYIVIDSGPSYSEELVATLMVVDSLIIVSTPDYPTLVATLRAAELVKHRKIPVRGILINKRKNKSFELTKTDIENKTGLPIIAEIKDDDMILKSVSKFMPITHYARFNSNTFRYLDLAKKIIMEDVNELEKKEEGKK